MKKFLAVLITLLLVGAFCVACTPGSVIDMLNGLGVSTPGDAQAATPGNGVSAVTPGSAPVASSGCAR